MSTATALGSRLWIGPTSTADTQAEFEALAAQFIEVDFIENLGEFGDQSSIVTGATLKTGRVLKFKSTRDAGDITLTCFANSNDPGQLALLDAFDENNLDFAFKVQTDDKDSISGEGEISYFLGKVTSKRKTVGAVDNIIRRNFMIAIDSAIIEIPAT